MVPCLDGVIAALPSIEGRWEAGVEEHLFSGEDLLQAHRVPHFESLVLLHTLPQFPLRAGIPHVERCSSPNPDHVVVRLADHQVIHLGLLFESNSGMGY